MPAAITSEGNDSELTSGASDLTTLPSDQTRRDSEQNGLVGSGDVFTTKRAVNFNASARNSKTTFPSFEPAKRLDFGTIASGTMQDELPPFDLGTEGLPSKYWRSVGLKPTNQAISSAIVGESPGGCSFTKRPHQHEDGHRRPSSFEWRPRRGVQTSVGHDAGAPNEDPTTEGDGGCRATAALGSGFIVENRTLDDNECWVWTRVGVDDGSVTPRRQVTATFKASL